jgi:hypothetical protein
MAEPCSVDFRFLQIGLQLSEVTRPVRVRQIGVGGVGIDVAPAVVDAGERTVESIAEGVDAVPGHGHSRLGVLSGLRGSPHFSQAHG